MHQNFIWSINSSKLTKCIKKLIFISSLINSVSLYIWLILFLTVVIGIISFFIPITINNAVNIGIEAGDFSKLRFYCLLYLAGIMLLNLTTFFQSLTLHNLSKNCALQLQSKILAHLFKQNSTFYDSVSTGDLYTRCTTEVGSIALILCKNASIVLSQLPAVAGAISALMILNYYLSVVVFLVFFIACIIIYIFAKNSKKHTETYSKQNSNINSFFLESIKLHENIKIFNAKKQWNKKYKNMTKEYQINLFKDFIFRCFNANFLMGLSTFTIGLIFVLFTQNSFNNDTLDYGLIIAFVLVADTIFNPLFSFGGTLNSLSTGFVYIDRFIAIMSRDFSLTKLTKKLLSYDDLQKSFNSSQNEILSFKNVSFFYKKINTDFLNDDLKQNKNNNAAIKDNKKLVLHDINFTIVKNSVSAIVGATGSGKSTIAKLIMKLYEDYSGSIKFHNSELSNISCELMDQNIMIVSQDVKIFSGSIKFNITLGRDNIFMDDIKKAAEITKISEYIEKLPNKYDYELKEDDQILSQSLKQLISLTRVLCVKPTLIIFDKATSSMDSSFIDSFYKMIDQLKTKASIIIITHQIKSIKSCDNIIVIGDGKIIESGTHEQLMNNKMLYYDYFTMN